MLTENQRKWVDALRSGKYKQCRLSLRNHQTNSYCCLGVLNQVAQDNGVQDAWDAGVVTASVASSRWVGLYETGATYGEQKWHSLLSHNDDGMSFSEIADIIESEPEGLFVKESQ